MKRKFLFLHYLLNQDKNSMIFRVLEATRENPSNNDFVKTCLKYLKQLDIQLSFEELAKMSKWSFKKLVKQQTTKSAFKYLTDIQIKQSKISHIKYDDLQIQEYLLDRNRNTDVSKFIYKARKSWKYSDNSCPGCGVKKETGNKILPCTGLMENTNDKIYQSLF